TLPRPPVLPPPAAGGSIGRSNRNEVSSRTEGGLSAVRRLRIVGGCRAPRRLSHHPEHGGGAVRCRWTSTSPLRFYDDHPRPGRHPRPARNPLESDHGRHVSDSGTARLWIRRDREAPALPQPIGHQPSLSVADHGG